MNKVEKVVEDQKKEIPEFSAGDIVKVHLRVKEGEKERIQIFEGVVIRRKGSGISESFSVRKVSFGISVEKSFPIHSPVIKEIEVIRKGKVRRSRIYYMRERYGKAARIKEKR